jgi:hypothetical protein
MSVMITVSVRPEHDWSFLHLICATHTARKNVSFIFNLQPASNTRTERERERAL